MTSAVVSRAVRGMPEEESDEESSSSSNDDEHAEQVKEVVRSGRLELSNKECQRRFANKFINLFRSVASIREVDGTLVVYKERYDLTNAREFRWHGYLLLHPMFLDIVGCGVTKFEVRFLPSRRNPHDEDKRVVDFVVHRTQEDEFKHVRLHPYRRATKAKHGGPKLEAEPIFRFLPDWLGKPTPGVAADNAHSLVGYGKARQPLHVTTHHRDAADFLEFLKEERKANSDSIVDLTSGDMFPWKAYFRCYSTFQGVLSEVPLLLY
jgi:hypothetical protein